MEGAAEDMRFGCCIRETADVPRVKAAGYDFYEFAGSAIAAMEEEEFERLVEQTRQSGIPCIGFNSYCSGIPAIVGDSFSPEETASYARLICGRGSRLGIRSIGIGAPAARRLPKNYPKHRADEQCRAFLEITAEEAHRHGIRLLFEAVHSGMCDYAVYTAEAARMVREIDSPDVGMVLDFYHMHVMGEGFSEGEKALPFLRHVHISTCGQELWRGYPQEPDREEYRAIFKWLKDHHYHETVSIEGNVFDLETASAAVQMLRDIDREVSV